MDTTKLVTDKELEHPVTPWKRATYQTARSRGNGPQYYRVNGRIYYDYYEVIEWFKQNSYQNTSSYESTCGGLHQIKTGD